MEPEFNEAFLKTKIDPLSLNHRILFALSCCERLLPNYLIFYKHHSWGEPKVLRYALDRVWSVLNGDEIVEEIENLIQKCDEVTPDTEDFDSIFVSPALDAASSVMLILEFVKNHSVEKVLEIASLSRDTVDMYIQELENMDSNDPNLEEKILGHHFMQRELVRQREDLELLRKAEVINEDVIIDLKRLWRGTEKSNIDL
jgi:uncharacterized protein YjaG (DUF416 family)